MNAHNLHEVAILIRLGSVFAVLTFIHFVVDWIFQTHDEAMAKSGNAWVRAQHCLTYTLGFVPLFIWLDLPLFDAWAAVLILFFSHFIEDTYVPVYLWARYIRRVPEVVKGVVVASSYSGSLRVDRGKDGFREWVHTPLGAILMITVDQIIHLAFLWPVAWIIAS